MITLKKSIEILELNIKEVGPKMPVDCLNALKLSVHAMRYLRVLRQDGDLDPSVLLPGEADENAT